MATATCVGSNIPEFEFLEDYILVAHTPTHIRVVIHTGDDWFVPVYSEDVYEVTDARGRKATFVTESLNNEV